MAHRTLCLGLIASLLPLFAGCCCPPRPEGPPPVAAGTVSERQVFIDVTTVRIPEREVSRVLGDLRPTTAAKPTSLTAAQATRLRATWGEASSIRMLHAPKLLALAGHEATVLIGETIRFAKTTVDTNESGGLEFGFDGYKGSPVFVGYQLRVIATPSADGETIQLEVHQLSRETTGAVDGAVMAGLDPKSFLRDHVFEDSFNTSFEMANSGHVLVGNPQLLEDGAGRHVRVTLMGARLMPIQQAPRLGTAPLAPLRP